MDGLTKVPYVYYIKNMTTQLKYIGVRYSKNCHPDDFWVTYFTSSKSVSTLIELYGKEDFEVRVIKRFDDEFDALVYERHLLTLATPRMDYLNLHTNFASPTKEDYYLHKEKMVKVHTFYAKLQSVLKYGFHSVSNEKRLEWCSLGGINAAKVNRKNKNGIFDPKVRDKQHKILREKQISAFYDPTTRKEISSSGGKVGYFSKAYYEKNGMTEEDRISAQSERGKIGGLKNRGFRWYNDNINDFKYTPKEQLTISFDEFLKINTDFKSGRIKKNK